VDRAREIPGAADAILHTLERFGLAWDGDVVRQSARTDAYRDALEHLRDAGLVYACSCSRGELPAADAGSEPRYPGTCRQGPRRPEAPLALRFRVGGTAGGTTVTVEDRLQGTLTQDVETTVGDFVLRRRDGYWAYQLAVVVDDAAQGVTDVVRGLDLWDNTPRQRLLQRTLGLPELRYLHLPLVTEPGGAKLAKSRRSVPADPAAAPALLSGVLRGLGIPLPDELAGAPVPEQLAWSAGRWDPARLQGHGTVAETGVTGA
jgi:glutamyl-Q tRNA(Asp) synthetase